MSDALRREGEAGLEGSPGLEQLAEKIRDIRHQLNGPLTAIMAEAELLLLDAGSLTADQRRGLVAIVEQARRLADLISELKEVE